MLATTINFDDVPVTQGQGVFVAPNRYAAQGVASIQTIVSIGDGLGVGDTFNASLPSNNFAVLANANSVSSPNFAVAASVVNGFLVFESAEVLIRFSDRVVSASAQTDDAAGESGEIVRLLGLKDLGNNLFEIVAVASGLDNEVDAPGKVLALNYVAGFDAIVFQTTTEQEGLDDLTFQAVPEPGTYLLSGVALIAIAGIRRKRS
ncbi:MAG: PEP-CTERM sorting domain-containing protein [Acidobacteria bacterium]|nr:PEP-CTERM sorting domain-containing protein [Acidobacteriota bacterium]